MSIENQNNSDNLHKAFQHKLEAIDEVPVGFHFQQQAVWNKLEGSLQNKKQAKLFPVWMRYAAAIIVLALVGSFLLISNNTSNETLVKRKPTLLNPVQHDLKDLNLENNKAESSLTEKTVANNSAVNNLNYWKRLPKSLSKKAALLLALIAIGWAIECRVILCH
jgi:hypothetical protein